MPSYLHTSVMHSLLKGKKQKLFSIFLLFIVVFGVYANSVTNEFTNWDDNALIVQNPYIRSLEISNLIKIFTPPKGGTFQPIRVLSYAIDYNFFKLNPIGYHIHSIFLQFLASVFLYLSLLYMVPGLLCLSRYGDGRFSLKSGIINGTALLTALLFAIHPVQVESVVWLSGRKYTLLGFFAFISLYFFLLYEEKHRYRILFAIGSFIGALCAVLSSPFGIMLPVLFLWYDFCVKKNFIKIFRQRFWIYCPYAFLFVSMLLVLRSALFAGSFFSGSHSVNIKTLWPTLLTLLRVIFDYMKNFLFPFRLNARYMDVISNSVFQPKVMISLVSVIGIIVLVLKGYVKEKKMLMFCTGWFFIALFPVSNIFPISTQMADRYIYLASVGPFLYASFLMSGFVVRFGCRHVSGNSSEIGISDVPVKSGWMNKLPGISVVLLIIFFCVVSINRNRVWKNSFTLWESSLKIEPLGYLAENNLGQAYADKGDFQEAIKHYKAALSLNESFAMAYDSLGKCYTSMGDDKKAVCQYLHALKLNPDYADAHNNLGNYFLKHGMLKKAEYHLKKALEKCTNCAEVYNNLSLLCLARGDIKGALKNIRMAMECRPDFAEAYNNFGRVLAAEHKYSEAIMNFRHAVKLNSHLPQPYDNMGVMFVMLGKYKDAAACFERALHVDPGYTDALNNLGTLYLMEKNPGKAIHCFKEILKVNPNNVVALARLAWALSAYKSPFRDVKKALGYIKRAFSGAGKTNPVLFDILAEVYAANGDFDTALRLADRGMELAKQQNKKKLFSSMKKRAEMYRKGKLYFESG